MFAKGIGGKSLCSSRYWLANCFDSSERRLIGPNFAYLSVFGMQFVRLGSPDRMQVPNLPVLSRCLVD